MNDSTAAIAFAVDHNNLTLLGGDVGFSDLGAFGSEIATPHMDSLAKRGLRYVRFDTNGVCSASRASLLDPVAALRQE
ncbi:MAG: sulfatase-like hydrolase/transferase [Hydrococcus sp. CSU_1_8]|nr:sulfatase-like hydrolase/transferase [Hydrococcus sp. CSU_1_8]